MGGSGRVGVRKERGEKNGENWGRKNMKKRIRGVLVGCGVWVAKIKIKKIKRNGRVSRGRLWSERKMGEELRNGVRRWGCRALWEYIEKRKKSGENGGKNGLVVVKGVVKRVGEKLGKKKRGSVVCG